MAMICGYQHNIGTEPHTTELSAHYPSFPLSLATIIDQSLPLKVSHKRNFSANLAQRLQ